MATSSFGAAAASLVADNNNNKPSAAAYLPLCHRRSFFLLRSSSSSSSNNNNNNNKLQLSFPNLLRLSSNKGLQSNWKSSFAVKAKLDEVSAASAPELSSADAKEDVKLSNEPALASEESISEFLAQVSSLVKLVDSKDIVELQLKQLDCEVIIRKKEALAPPPSPPVTYVQSQTQPAFSPPVSAPSPAPTPAPSASPTPAPSPPKALPSKSSHPPLKCPMAGTFYRSPAPGEPPFVKVGDKVQKGQVICIIEAMKLMNEIEADQSGTIVEIIAEDGKPVSVDTPLLVIEP